MWEMWRWILIEMDFALYNSVNAICFEWMMENKWIRINSMDTSLKLNLRTNVVNIKLHLPLELKLKLNWCQYHVCLFCSINVAIWWQNQLKIQQKQRMHLCEQMDNEHTISIVCIVDDTFHHNAESNAHFQPITSLADTRPFHSTPHHTHFILTR